MSSASKLDPYAALGIDRDADDATIRRAYRQEAKRTHPDSGGNAEDFADVARSQLVLLDPVRRRKYDTTGEIDEDGADNTEASARELIAGLLGQILANDQDPFVCDLVGSLRMTLEKQIEETAAINAKLRRADERAEKMRGRFGCLKGENQIEPMLTWHRAAIKQQIAHNETAIAQRRLAIEFLQDYSFKADEPEFEVSLPQFYFAGNRRRPFR